MEAFARIELGGNKVDLTPQNTAVYRHIARLALFDHIYIRDGEQAGYVWAHSPVFGRLIDLALAADVPTHTNLQVVDRRDENAYIAMYTKDLQAAGSFPEEWETDGTPES